MPARRPCSRCGDLRPVHKNTSRDEIVCRACRALAPQPSGNYKMKTCTNCGQEFRAGTGNMTCSTSCASVRIMAGSALRVKAAKTPQEKLQMRRERDRRKNHKRRAEIRAAFVEDVKPLRVYARDGWRCHICGLKVDQRLSGLHQRGPTLDHLIPLSKGGQHSYDNVALAHRVCNTKKHAKNVSFQMLLIA